MELGCTTHTCMGKTKPRNFRTTDQTDKVDDFFQKSIIYGFGQFGWTNISKHIWTWGQTGCNSSKQAFGLEARLILEILLQ